MSILKKIFRLRRKGAERESGYYWVLWSYRKGQIEGDLWKIGFYHSGLQTWSLPGDLRFFKDDDFIKVIEQPVTGFPWLLINKIVLVIAILLCGFSLTMNVLDIIHRIKHVIK